MATGSIDRRTFIAGLAAMASGLPSLFGPGVRAATPAKAALPTVRSAIVVRTTENVTGGSWVWLLNSARQAGIRRIYLLIKQDENNYQSGATGRKLRSGEMLLPFTDGNVAAGWEDPAWLHEMLARARSFGIEIHAWWPCFQDAVAADLLPEARYAGGENDVFLDPAFPEVGLYQARRLQSILEKYPFDGVALDWLRYNDRADGSAGPLAADFRNLSGRAWSKELMAEPLARATWDDLRARTIASWTEELLASMRPRHPIVVWSSFVLPWTFKEVAQSYRHLSAAGLDALQPMIYWRDWNEDLTFTSEVLRPVPFQLSGRTTIDPTFDITGSSEDLSKALELIPR
ncbi:MAG: family 10 glycosylhydrolase, partial [Thermoleophilia bacterium]|nr:family 10 glycosylhydrolase [Thermoleophilia bacterium]